MKKLILNFNSKDSKKIKNPKNFLGGKGANLSEMGRMGLPVPPGFTISTKVCEIFYKDKKKLNKNLISQIKKKDVSIILVDKYLNKIKQFADKLYILERGENAWNGKPSLLTNQIVKKYLSV